MLDLHRQLFKGLEAKTAKIFAVLPLSPNFYTALSLVFAAAAALSLALGDYPLALAFVFAAAAMDFIDGGVARRKNAVTVTGAYWDTVADRYVEAMMLFGLLFCPLPDFLAPAFVWIFLALFGGVMTTYAKAAAHEKNVPGEIKGGFMSRAERLLAIALIIAFLPAGGMASSYFLAALAALANFTALQRIGAALRRGGSKAVTGNIRR